MRQHEDVVHSEVFLRVMEEQKKRKRRRQLRNKVLIHIANTIAAILIGIQMVLWLTCIANAQEAELTENETYLLAKIAMAEAEGEDTEGKALVILTILNRVESDLRYFPDTIEEVIYQERQFTPVQSGRFDEVEPNEDCYKALEMVESGWDESQGALYFERTTEKSTWHSRNLKELFDHGKHTFYKEYDNGR